GEQLTGGLLDLQLDGVHVFAGVGGSRTTTTVSDGTVGLSLTGVSGRLETLTVGAASYTGLRLTVATGSLTGLGSAFSFDIANGFVRYNAASTGASKLDWDGLTDTHRLQDVTGGLALAVGAEIGVTLGGVL